MSSRTDHPWANVLLHLNPMTGLVAAFRNVCVGQPINYVQLSGLVASSAPVFVIGFCFFRRSNPASPTSSDPRRLKPGPSHSARDAARFAQPTLRGQARSRLPFGSKLLELRGGAWKSYASV